MATILVVDDSAATRARVVSLLGGRVSVLEADTRAGALLLLTREPCDALIVDLSLPDGSGSDIVEAAKRTMPDRPAVVLTAFANDVARELCARRGADRVFDKVTELETCVAFVLELARGGWR